MIRNYFFNPRHPLKPFSRSLPANKGGLPPANATRLAPEFENGFWPCWDGRQWIKAEDHRGLSGWLNGQKYTVEALGPLPGGFSETPPPPDPEAIRQTRLAEIEKELARLDAEFFTPRVMANLALGDEYALAQYEKHEAEADPLRRERAELMPIF